MACSVLTDPAREMVACRTTVPAIWAARAEAGYSGLGAESRFPAMMDGETYLNLELFDSDAADDEAFALSLPEAGGGEEVPVMGAAGEPDAGLDAEPAGGAASGAAAVLETFAEPPLPK